MRLDCIKNTETNNPDKLWVIIDRDSNNEEFVAASCIDSAWYRAAMRLEKRVNDARLILEA